MTELEVSCPLCNSMNKVETELRKSSLSDLFAQLYPTDNLKQYSFAGDKKCSKCGASITVAVSVSGGK